MAQTFLRAAVLAVVIGALSMILAGEADAAPRANNHAAQPRDQVYVRRVGRHAISSITLHPLSPSSFEQWSFVPPIRPFDGKVYYGSGGVNGTRHRFFAGFYRIKGDIIVLYEYNGHKSLGDGHQTYLAFSSEAMCDSRFSIWRRLQ
jgi:hypothetical protein